MWLLYQLAVGLALVVLGPFLLAVRGRHYLASCATRLGLRWAGVEIAAQEPERPLWLHAVSVGEVGVAATLARELPMDVPLIVTTVTPTGQARARTLLGERARVTYLPFELGFAVERFFRSFGPRALVLSEGDLWPLVLRAARRRGLPIAVINGRIGDRSFARMRFFRRLLGPLLDPIHCFAVQTAEDRRRLLELGVSEERVVETGNLKFETGDPRPAPEAERWLKERADGRPVLLAGSTMRQEEASVLSAFEAGAAGRAMLVLAPRHPERFTEVEQLVRSRGHQIVRRSSLEGASRPDVVLLDTVGELAALYRLAKGAFIGGTLVRTGGHNPLEAAHFSVPTAVGPSMENFRAIARAFDESDAWVRVDNAAELGAAWQTWLDDPETARQLGRRGRELIDAHRGAAERTIEALRPVLGGLLGPTLDESGRPHSSSPSLGEAAP